MANRTDHARAEAAFAEFKHSGSPRAMAEVFDRTATGLLLFARRFARDAATAEDLVQQTFLRAIERAATFAPGSQLMPWLTAILANEARMELRGRRTPDAGRIANVTTEEPCHAAERREAADAMHTALEQLPPAYRDVVALRFLHGTRPGHIATALDVPLPTVKTRLHRGMRKLAASLPPGLALGTTVALCAGRGLPACRSAVTSAAGVSTAATWTLTGLLAMKKTILLAIGLLLLAALWLVFPMIAPGNEPAVASSASTPAVLPASRTAVETPQREHSDPAAAAVRTAVDVPVPEQKANANTIEVRARWHPSGQPAANVPFTLLVQPNDWLASSTTDAGGTATFDLDRIDGLESRAPVGVSISCAFRQGRYYGVNLAEPAPSPRVVEIEVEEGRQVTGIVVDAMGIAVPGAAIWLTVNYMAATLVVHADAAGHFTLRGLLPGFSLRATHGSAASAAITAADLDGDRVVLALAGDAARLEVLVTGPAGGLLAGAAVHLDDRNRSADQRWFAVTDKDGHASLAGIALGKYQLEVVHPSFAPIQREVVFTNAEERSETVKMGPAAELVGCVRRARGEVVAGAWVALGYDVGSLLWSSTHTDRDGRFRFVGVAVGRHWLEVSHAVPDHRRSVELHAGRQELEIVVPGTRRIVGQLVDPEKRPLGGWNVRARPLSDWSFMTSHTSGDGRFVFDGLSDAPYVLEVGARRATATFHDVRTDGVEKVYQVPASGMPRAFVVGQVEGAAGCSITISPRGAYREFQEYEAVPEGGRFELGPLPPIAHDVGLSIADRKHTWWFVTADLATTDRCDLGLIRVPELGTLEVTVRDDLGCKRLGVGARPVHLGQSEAVGLERQGRDTWKGTDLPAGEYDVYVDDEQTAPMTQRVTVLPARTTKIVLVTAPGSVLAYRLALPDGVPKTVGYQMITFRSADGSVVDCWSGMGSLKRRTRLLDGSYTIDVTTGSGLRGNTTVVLPQPSGAEAVIPLTR